jgi:hypothetical protein
MTTTYTVPDNPTDPEAAALELTCGSPRTSCTPPRSGRCCDGRWWMIRIPDVDGLAQARRLSEVDYMARDYLAPATHTPIDKIAVHVFSVEVPPLGDIASGAQRIVHDRIAAAEASTKAQEDAAEYARELVAAKVPIRDVADLLGLSFQRVSQLVTPRVD